MNNLETQSTEQLPAAYGGNGLAKGCYPEMADCPNLTSDDRSMVFRF